MNVFKLNQNQFSDLINLHHGVFKPLNNFVNKKEFVEILDNLKFKKYFFPYPIFFGMNKKDYLIYKNVKNLTLIYKSKKIAEINSIHFYSINKVKFGKEIYGKNFKKHPYFKKFIADNYKFLNFNIKKIYNYKLKKDIFISPKEFRQGSKKKLASFHTRNVPHNCHRWIHRYLLNKFKYLLIQPLIGQYKKGEYKDETIIKLNNLISNKSNKKKVFVIPFFSYPRYGGPREASLHAIVRKNYGCSHFWVGRDHAGYKNFFKRFESQKFCKFYEKELGIKIIAEKEPYYCNNLKKVVNMCDCKQHNTIKISGSMIRKLILKNKEIPEILMEKQISKYLNKNSLIY